MLSVVVFDLDETLVASPGLQPLWVATCQEQGLPVEQMTDIWFGSRGLTLYEQLAKADVSDPARQDEIVAAFWALYDYSAVIALPHAVETIRALADVGMCLHLSTGSAPEVAQGVLESLELARHFISINGSTREFPKGLAHLRHIAEVEDLELPVLAAQAAFVGDGQFDMIYGAQAGFAHRIGVTGGNESHRPDLLEAGATAVVSNLAEALELIDSVRQGRPGKRPVGDR